MLVWGYSRSTDEYEVRRNFLRLRSDLLSALTDDIEFAAHGVAKSINQAVTAYRNDPGGFPLIAMELVAEGCFYEAERILQSTEISLELLDILEEAFTAMADESLMSHAIRADLEFIETTRISPKRVLRGTIGFLTYYNAYLRSELRATRSPSLAARFAFDYVSSQSLEVLQIVVGLLLQNRKSRQEYRIREGLALRALTDLAAALREPYPDRLHMCRLQYENRSDVPGDKDAFLMAEYDAWRITRCRLALQTIEITRYRLSNRRLPLSLDDVPQYIDPYSALPFRYARVPGGMQLASSGPGPIFEKVEDMSFYDPYLGKRPHFLVCTIMPGRDRFVGPDGFGLVAAYDRILV